MGDVKVARRNGCVAGWLPVPPHEAAILQPIVGCAPCYKWLPCNTLKINNPDMRNNRDVVDRKDDVASYRDSMREGVAFPSVIVAAVIDAGGAGEPDTLVTGYTRARACLSLKDSHIHCLVLPPLPLVAIKKLRVRIDGTNGMASSRRDIINQLAAIVRESPGMYAPGRPGNNALANLVADFRGVCTAKDVRDAVASLDAREKMRAYDVATDRLTDAHLAAAKDIGNQDLKAYLFRRAVATHASACDVRSVADRLVSGLLKSEPADELCRIVDEMMPARTHPSRRTRTQQEKGLRYLREIKNHLSKYKSWHDIEFNADQRDQFLSDWKELQYHVAKLLSDQGVRGRP